MWCCKPWRTVFDMCRGMWVMWVISSLPSTFAILHLIWSPLVDKNPANTQGISCIYWHNWYCTRVLAWHLSLFNPLFVPSFINSFINAAFIQSDQYIIYFILFHDMQKVSLYMFSCAPELPGSSIAMGHRSGLVGGCRQLLDNWQHHENKPLSSESVETVILNDLGL